MADFVRNESGDLAICDGDLVINDDGTSVVQAVKERLRSFAGEWFLDSEGLPYLTDIWGRSVSYRAIHALLLETITQTEGVAFVSRFEITLNTETRQLDVSCAFQSIFNSAEDFEACVGPATPETPIIPPVSATSIIQDLLGESITDLTNDELRDLT